MHTPEKEPEFKGFHLGPWNCLFHPTDSPPDTISRIFMTNTDVPEKPLCKHVLFEIF